MHGQRPVLHAGLRAQGVQDDGDEASAQHGEDEVPHAASRGISILAIAIEEHRQAVEQAGQQTEGVAHALLRELGRRGLEAEVEAEELAAHAEAEQALAEQHADEHDEQADPLQAAHGLLAEDAGRQHADHRAGVDEQYGIGNGREQRGRHVACQGHTNHQTAESDGGSELEFLEGLHLVSGDHQDNEEQHAHAHAAAGHESADGVTGVQAQGAIEHIRSRGPAAEQGHEAHAGCRDEHGNGTPPGLHLIALGGVGVFLCHNPSFFFPLR